MRILVYGAGVIGCELAHELNKNKKNDVTLLARGEWKRTIDKNGLVIRHYAQLKTTKENIATIDTLEADDCYDMIFVVMQYSQQKEVLPIVAKNKSRYIVVVGNNADPDLCMKLLTSEPTGEISQKEIAFGFQGTGGRRENGKVVSIHVAAGMTIGGLENELSEEFTKRLNCIIENTGYRFTFENNMRGWLLCHLVFILPICYLCYQLDGKLPKAKKKQMEQIFDAVIESHQLLKQKGYLIRPDGEEEYFTENRKKNLKMLYIMAKTPLGRLAASDHAMHAVGEMKALDDAIEKLRKDYGFPMPVWDTMRKDAMNSRAWKSN